MIAKSNSMDRDPSDPTSCEIRMRCLEIQAEWSPRIRNARLGFVQSAWQPPVYSQSDIPELDSVDE